ncbi:ComF family protein [Pseudidiomarina insulisalsae]|uniref:ComF family protein n=1 Tax=Pseudidiomarina insulisalsae TaxID=575789 RepID=A0A432YPY2_9GAMM|nr:phosphoribosyltransferase family protein [Pseudidiomarina insulisalsae]RUO63024.1 ComF family protein [Pseudidiomarina insulisalsae]
MVPLEQMFAKLPGGCCWLCLLPLKATEASGFCRACFADLPRLPPRCLHWRGSIQAQRHGRYWFAALAWQRDSRQLVTCLKFQRSPELVRWLAPLLSAQVMACYQSYGVALPDCVVAMPMTAKRWRQRGYNQASLLAKAVAEQLQRPYAPGLLRRLTDEQRQHKLSRRQRWQSMENAMHCTRSVGGLTVAVVDDVLTSGASVTAAAAALQRRGAKAVDAWTLCYTEPLHAGDS